MNFAVLIAVFSLCHANAFVTPPSSAYKEVVFSSSCMSMTQKQPSLGRFATSAPIPPPPPLSMPVWSLSCPIPVTQSSQSSSMSILTFVTPVSVSSPKLWAISLYKTSLTRCAFLGVSKSGEEYNDIAAISSSVNTMPGATNSVRRRNAMGDVGVIGSYSVEGAAGWRRGRYSSDTGSSSSGVGVGILQLLRPNQSNLVEALGKKTGWDEQVDKRKECASLGNEWISIVGSDDEIQYDVLPNCASYMQVKLKRVTDGGDHDVAICEVIGVGVWDNAKQTVVWQRDDSNSDNQSTTALDPSSVLYSGQLREAEII